MKATAFFFHNSCSISAVPEVYVPGLFKDLVTKDKAVIWTESVIFRLSIIPQPPEIVQFFPITVLPAIAVFAAIAVALPIITLWAIWTWLSILSWSFPGGADAGDWEGQGDASKILLNFSQIQIYHLFE